MSRRRSSLRAVAWWLPLMAVVIVLAAAEAIVSRAAGLVAVIVVLPVAGYTLGRWHGRRRSHRHLDERPVGERAADELARLRGLVAELEAAAGRPLDAIAASYRRIQRSYGDRR